jgi:hypothetical protein
VAREVGEREGVAEVDSRPPPPVCFLLELDRGSSEPGWVKGSNSARKLSAQASCKSDW